MIDNARRLWETTGYDILVFEAKPCQTTFGSRPLVFKNYGNIVELFHRTLQSIKIKELLMASSMRSIT